MFGWLTRTRKMAGGLYFGPPAWAPAEIEVYPREGNGSGEKCAPHPPAPEERHGFLRWIERIGLGRTSAMVPSVGEQLEELGERRIRVMVLNMLPTQPEFALAHGLTMAALPELIEGLAILQAVVRAGRIMVVMDQHDWRIRRAWRRARKTLPKSLAGLELRGVLNQYPQAHPTILLRTLFGKRLAVGRLPTRTNRLMVDPVSCWAMARAARISRSICERPVQLLVQGERGDGAARLVMMPIGETIDRVCLRLGVSVAGRQVIVNGMLMGEQVDTGTARVGTMTESIEVREPAATEWPTACISCGWCVDVCPTSLNPVTLLDLAERAQRIDEGRITMEGELRGPDAHESLHCIGCGLCSYVCPTRLPLTQQTLRLRAMVEGGTGR